ncbi:MAG TPA: hypothetical protein ENN65_03885 [Candidatus Hydrogenedentes bacterium]|nr:hypothetical protein [Candidatus Hydrogenedentota bacterium]
MKTKNSALVLAVLWTALAACTAHAANVNADGAMLLLPAADIWSGASQTNADGIRINLVGMYYEGGDFLNADNAWLRLSPVMTFEAVEGDHEHHSADQNNDNLISLSELLRVIQFFNSGGYHCADPPGSTEDSYVPGQNPAQQSCTPHASDYNPQNWLISLSELLRLIQFYNSGGYHYCPDAEPPTEDGYCPGLPPGG